MIEKMKILIGYDGSDCAESALDDLQRAGLPPEARALILSVAEVWLPPPPPSSYEIVEQARQVSVPADLKRVYARGSAATKQALVICRPGGYSAADKLPRLGNNNRSFVRLSRMGVGYEIRSMGT